MTKLLAYDMNMVLKFPKHSKFTVNFRFVNEKICTASSAAPIVISS